MAQSRRVPQIEIYAAHGDAARAAMSGAPTDEAISAHGAAAAAHDTAARLIAHAARCDVRAAAARANAGLARSRRMFGDAEDADREATEQTQAAAFAREQAEKWHEQGHAHTVVARAASTPEVAEEAAIPALPQRRRPAVTESGSV